jgi:hypothetical protein
VLTEEEWNSAPQQLKDMVNVLREMVGLHKVE